ncbi:MAG TPA: signal peptidase I [Thermoanaerobaculia bacterium]
MNIAVAPSHRPRDVVEVVVVAVLLALYVRTFLLQAFVVPTPSMEDTVLVGDRLLVNKFIFARHARWEEKLLPHRPVRRGDVIVFQFPQDPRSDFIKRAVALPGDTIEIEGRTVRINGAPEQGAHAHYSDAARSADSAFDDPLGRRDRLAPRRMPERMYFAMGDNRDNSNDSRFWGPVPAENLKGRALCVYWSSTEEVRKAGSWRRLTALFTATRWTRMMRFVR